MKNNIKNIYLFTTNMFHTIVSLLSVLFFSSIRCNKKIKKCINKYKKFNECIILGNGPSLTSFLENNLDETSDKNIFAVNFFCNTKYFEIIKPSYYVLLDPQLFAKSSTEDMQINLEKLVSKLNIIFWPMVLFIPYRFKQSKLLKSLNSLNLTIVHFNDTPINGIKRVENYLFNRNLGMPISETVINATIFLAINMKFKTIHLYGVEQSWLKFLSINNDNQVSVGLPHFYSGSDKTGEIKSLSVFLFSQAKVFKSHMRLQEYAKYHGNRILNHTPDSYIDAYEREIKD